MPSPESSECQVCHLPLAQTASATASKACPFCNKSFGRVDGARRHAKTCPSRKGRPLPQEAKRGRKTRACDACSRIKVSCNAQTPCQRCIKRQLTCTYDRICIDPTHRRDHRIRVPEKIKSFPFPFLLSCSDPRVNFVNDVIVPGEPEQDPATASSTTPTSIDNSNDNIDSIGVMDSIDPRFLFHGFMDPYFGMSLDDTSMDGLSLNMDIDVFSSVHPPLASLTGLPSEEDVLAPRVVRLEAELLQLVARQPGSLPTLYAACKTFFANANFHRLIALFFGRQQLLARLIHWPTFDAGQVDASLLLAISLCGVAYLQSSAPNSVFSSDTTAKLVSSSAAIQSLAEKYIFSRLKTACKEQRNHIVSANNENRTLDICQAAYLVGLLQISVNDHDNVTRRRIMTKRQPALVDALRHLGMLNTSSSSSSSLISESDTDPWRTFVYKESCNRLALWVLFSDGFLALICNAPPNTTVAEMTSDFPCRGEIWEAASAEIYAEERKRDEEGQVNIVLPSVKDVLTALLDDGDDAWQTPACQALTVFHLYSVVGALQFVLFSFRFNALPSSFGSVILRALDRWSTLWQAALARVPSDQQRWLGVAKHAPEFALIARRIVQVSLQPSVSKNTNGNTINSAAKYLQCTPEYDLRVFHAFLVEYGTP